MSNQTPASFIIHKNPNIASNSLNQSVPKKPTFDMSSSLDLGEFSKITAPKITKPIPPDSSKGFVMSVSRRGQEDFQ